MHNVLAALLLQASCLVDACKQYMMDSLEKTNADWAWPVFLAGHHLSDAELVAAAMRKLSDYALIDNEIVPLLSSALSYFVDKPQQQLQYLRAGIRQAVGDCDPSEVLLPVLLLRLDQLGGGRGGVVGESEHKGLQRKRKCPSDPPPTAAAEPEGGEGPSLNEQQVLALLELLDWGDLQPAELKALGSMVRSCERGTAGLQLVKDNLLEQLSAAVCATTEGGGEGEEDQHQQGGKGRASYLATWYVTSGSRSPPESDDSGRIMGKVKSFDLEAELKVFVDEEGEHSMFV